MTKLKIYILLLLIFWGCSPQSKNHTKSISVSILPQKTFVEKIAGKEYAIHVLVPPGASPSTYELEPSKMVAISKSAIWFKIGHIGFEQAWSRKIIESNPHIKVIDLSKGLDLIQAEHSHFNKTHIGIDPHTWLSPQMVKKMSTDIFEELCKINPERKEEYQRNLNKFIKEINATDSTLTHILTKTKNRNFIIFHPSLGYLARNYKLTQNSIEVEGKKPNPQNMKEVVDLAKEKSIKVILIQKEFDIENAQTIAKEIDGKVVVIDPLSTDWSQNLINIAKNIADNTK